ncbi:GntT/GntP/DsdX family permease [Bifidobacterium catulorum]|uniref:GntT/GntP/DsdX family permease n=1 Tax=Bifidobacterium catulorum TaxID=1630173 RepID=UPI001304B9BC|nr:Na+/H+ antiporter NhaC family protein [Bifidobacterium catulorum]
MQFLNNPEVALLLSLMFAMIALFTATHYSWKRLNDAAAASLGPVCGIILILSAGGGFKTVLIDTGVGDMITHFVQSSHISILLVGWLIAAFVRVSTGSSTVASIATGGVLAPVAQALQLSSVGVALLVLAIGAGSVFLSHVNDAGLWLVKEFFGLTLKETFKTWSVMECLLSMWALIVIMLVSIPLM